MGSATREALASAVATLASEDASDLATGEQLLEAGRIIGGSSKLRQALADHSLAGDSKRGIVGALFGSFTPVAQTVLGAVVVGRWSSEKDLLAGIEELGIRAVASSAPGSLSIESELFSFQKAVASDAGLEYAIGSKMGVPEAKASVVSSLLDGKASTQTIAIIRHLVLQPRGRRIGELLRFATSVVADQSGQSVATVITANTLEPEQLERLRRGLAARYGRSLRVNQVTDPRLIGGVRVEIGADVIDGSVATKLNDLRLQLAR